MYQGPDEDQKLMVQEPLLPNQAPVLGARHTFGSLTDKIVAIVLRRPVTLGWFIGMVIGVTELMELW